jgi:GT2 family glycosyltransferase
METVTPKVSIIIPHYNQKECLKVLLPSVANQTLRDYEVIIVDDCSPDKSVIEFIRDFIKDRPNMRLVENTENMRFIKTVNKGIKLAAGEYICLLNQDTEVRSNFVHRNVEIMDADRSIGGLSCIVVDKEGQNWFSGGIFLKGWPVNLLDDFQGIRTVDFVAGTACFYRKEVFDKTGLFDEDFVMYHEDVEFGLRMKAKTNYRACAFAEKLVIHHVVPSMPRGNFDYYNNRNHIVLVRRYSKRYIPKTILLLSLKSLRQTANLLFLFLTKRDLKPLVYSPYPIRGILAGLIKRENN